MTKFKVGDRVRFKKSYPTSVAGSEAVVVAVTNLGIQVNTPSFGRSTESPDSIEPALTIETGKFYRTRDGRKVGPMRQYNGGWLYETDDHGRMWRDDGMRYYEESRGGGSDLISEWVDEPASNDNRPATKPAIVALIEKGQPKPSEQPRVHASEYAAIKEAKRLANRHKGQQFGVFVLSKTVSEPIPLYEHEWQNLAANGQKVAAIKELRRITGLGLAATKRAIEHWAEHDEQYSRRAA